MLVPRWTAVYCEQSAAFHSGFLARLDCQFRAPDSNQKGLPSANQKGGPSQLLRRRKNVRRVTFSDAPPVTHRVQSEPMLLPNTVRAVGSMMGRVFAYFAQRGSAIPKVQPYDKARIARQLTGALEQQFTIVVSGHISAIGNALLVNPAPLWTLCTAEPSWGTPEAKEALDFFVNASATPSATRVEDVGASRHFVE